MTPTSSQVEEVQLLQSALVTPEEFKWVGTAEDINAWEASLKTGQVDPTAPPASYSYSYSIRVQTDPPQVWLDVDCSRDAQKDATVDVRCVDKVDDEQLNRVKSVMQRQYEQSGQDAIDHRIFDLFTFLQSYLVDEPVIPGRPEPSSSSLPTATPQRSLSRVIIWSHHLIAPSKRRDLNNWARELDVWILLKIGYPGYLCFEGYTHDVDEIVRRVKGLQWHAISVRYTEQWHVEPSETTVEPIMQCGLAKGATAAAAATSSSSKSSANTSARTTCDEVEAIKDVMDRLRLAGMQEHEIIDALGMRKKATGGSAKD